MSQLQPTQPDLPQYPISDLYLFPNYADRASCLAATGHQAPPFNAALPIKGWADPAPSGQPYSVFDSTAEVTGYIVPLTVPASSAGFNLPGAYNYPTYVRTPTDAQTVGPFGPIGAVDPDTVCLQADAQTLAGRMAPLYPGKPVTVVDNSARGVYHTVYGMDPRRQWGIAISGAQTFTFAQALIEASYAYGVGAPGHWTLAPLPASTAPPQLTWVEDAAVTAAPANAVMVPAPIRALLPNEQFQWVPPSNPLFGTGTWMVVRTDMPQTAAPPTTDQQLASMQLQIAALEAAIAQLQTALQAALAK